METVVFPKPTTHVLILNPIQDWDLDNPAAKNEGSVANLLDELKWIGAITPGGEKFCSR
jgi:hypothetical protein